jgi:hypothetical protein
VREEKNNTKTQPMKKNTQLKIALALAVMLSLAGCSLFGTNPSAPVAAEHFLFDVQTNHTLLVTTTPTGGLVTNDQLSYVLTTKPATAAAVNTAGTVANTFLPGVGSLASMGILALLGLWAQLRGQKSSNTADAIAQEVETIREFIKTLPNGTKYDTAITSWLQTHQVETGTANQVLSILENTVSNPDALAAVTEIKNTLTAASTP